MTRPTATLLALSLAGAACGGPRVGGPNPDPFAGGGAVPTYQAIAGTIFAGSCATSGCHTGDPPRSAPDSFDVDLAYGLVDRPSLQVPAMAIIAPGHPEQSYLMAKLAGTAAAVGGVATRMPLNAPPLSEEDVGAVARWIGAGAPHD